MMKRLTTTMVLSGLLCVPAMSTDMYSARKAYADKDFPAAFGQFKELAQIGSVEAQENLAVMYVNGQGVTRSNVLAYAWASLALEQGGGEAAKGIVGQLEPHMNDAARKRVAVVRDEFGQQALQARLLPIPIPREARKKRAGCAIFRPANPSDYYPPSAVRNGVSGRVMVDVPIAPDGRARNPRIIYALPPGVFEDAVRGVAINTAYEPAAPNDGPCTLRYFVKFVYQGSDLKELAEKLEGTRQRAVAGDPASQFTLGLLLNAPDLDTKNEDSLPWYVKAAQAGVAGAQVMVGSGLFTGGTVERDVSKAILWYEKAASQGLVSAQIALANYLLRPDGTGDEHTKAVALLEKSVAAGSRDAHLYLAAVLAANPQAGLRNPARAVTLIDTLKVIDDEPAAFEIRAAANAMLGLFAEAQADQKKAVIAARKRKWDPAPLQARLDRYLAKQTWTGELMLY